MTPLDKTVELLKKKYPPLTDESIMEFGKLHKGKKLKDVPADHLLWWFNETDIHEKALLFNYILDNLDTLVQESTTARKNKKQNG
jgi:uncharacterized protein (DUF3820 family)